MACRALLLLVLLGVSCGRRSAETAPRPTVPEAAPREAPKLIPKPIPKRPPLVVDSAMTPRQALGKNHFPSNILKEQRLVNVRYVGFDGRLHQGQVVVHKDLATEVKAIFEEIRASGFPIARVIPIVRYDWSDDLSVAANNTSGFNYRRVAGTRVLSRHATGRAIDLNPLQNPYIGHSARPYDPAVRGTFTRDDPVVTAFRRRGWTWGGSWKQKDYQHFEKK